MKETKTIRDETDNDDIPRNAKDFIAFLQNKLDELSEEQRATAEIEIEADEKWGCPTATVVLTYRRPETNQEEWMREDLARGRKNATIRKEKEQLALLQKKYGEGPYRVGSA